MPREFSLVHPDRELPTTGQVVGRTLWAAVLLVVLVLFAAAVTSSITPVPAWGALTMLPALLLAVLLLMATRVSRPRLRYRFVRARLVTVVRDAAARDRLPVGDQQQKAAGAYACLEIEGLILFTSSILAMVTAIVLWPVGPTWGPLIVSFVNIGVLFAPGAVRGMKYLGLYHRDGSR